MGDLTRKLKPAEIIGGVVVCAITLWWLASEPQEKAAGNGRPELAQESAQVRPEAIVKMKPDTFACVSLDDLERAIAHAVGKEKTKFEAMFAEVKCSAIPPDEAFKIVHVGHGVVEFVNIKSSSPDGMWTNIESILP